MSDISINGQSGANQIRLRVQSGGGQARITGNDGIDPVDLRVSYSEEKSSIQGQIGTKFVQLQRLGHNLTGTVDGETVCVGDALGPIQGKLGPNQLAGQWQGNTFRGNCSMIVDVKRSGDCDLNPMDYIVAFGQY
jgi:hypothetical protein